MADAEGQPKMPWLGRLVGPVVGLVVGLVVGQEADRLVDVVGTEVVAAGEAARGREHFTARRVVAHPLGRVRVGLGVHEAAEAVVDAAQRPAVERAGKAGLAQRRDMPLAGRVIDVTVGAQHLGQRGSLGRDLAAVAGATTVEVGQAAHAHPVVVAAGHQRGAGGRAHRLGGEAGHATTARGPRVDRRRCTHPRTDLGTDLGTELSRCAPSARQAVATGPPQPTTTQHASAGSFARSSAQSSARLSWRTDTATAKRPASSARLG